MDKIISPEVYPLLDPRYQQKIINSFIVGNQDDLDDKDLDFYAIENYFLNLFRVPREEKILFYSSTKYEIVWQRRWIMLFSYLTGKYTYEYIAGKIGRKGRKYRNHTYASNKTLLELISVDPNIKKQYESHLNNLKKLFITFTIENK